MSIVTNCLNGIEYDVMLERINSMLPKNGVIYLNQLDCAVRALKQFDGNFPRPNHLIVKGKTQAGKTGVLTAIIMLIRELNLSDALRINKIFYITGDNSCRLIKETYSRVSECFSGYDKCDFICLKNSDLKKQLTTDKIELNKSMVFIDESHYGTSNDKNIVIKWLEHNSLDMHNPKNLSDKSIYIISNSATPYAEIYSDVALVKGYCELYTDDWNGKKGYVGFSQYSSKGCVQPVTSGLSKKNVEEICQKFLLSITEIKEKTGKDKCALIRMSKSNFKKCEDILNKYFRIETFFATGENINYAEIENKMEHDCGCYDKPLLFVIAGAYRMGVSIPPYCKKNIGVIYDFACGGKKTVVTTEQGLLGRVTGYWGCDDWYDMTIYINEKHQKALNACYNEHATSTPQVTVKEKFVADNNGTVIYIEEGDHYKFDDKTLPLKEFFSDEYDGKYNEKVINFLRQERNTKQLGDEWVEFFKNAVFFNGRKLKIGSTFKDEAYFGKKEILEHRNGRGLSEENVNKNCFTYHYKCETNTIDILVGKIVRGNWVNIYDDKNKIVETLKTEK